MNMFLISFNSVFFSDLRKEKEWKKIFSFWSKLLVSVCCSFCCSINCQKLKMALLSKLITRSARQEPQYLNSLNYLLIKNDAKQIRRKILDTFLVKEFLTEKNNLKIPQLPLVWLCALRHVYV